MIYLNKREANRKKRSQEIKKQNVQQRKLQERLSLDFRLIPSEFQYLHKIAEKWGTSDVLIREDLYDNSSRQELLLLKDAIEKSKDELIQYLSKSQETKEFKAIQNSYMAYEELGLWTWE